MDERLEPIIVNLGKRKAKQLRALADDHGPAAEEVAEAMAQVRAQLGAAAEGKTIVPVVVVYKKKKAKNVFPF